MKKKFFLNIFFPLISSLIFCSVKYLSQFEIIQCLGESASVDVELGDFNHDGYIDAFVANHYDDEDQIWLGNGDGTFREGPSLLSNYNSYRVALGDFNDDGYTDAFVVNYAFENKVWINLGKDNAGDWKGFEDKPQVIQEPPKTSYGVALGRINNDDYIDAFVANHNNQPNKVLFNDGNGNFTDSGQNLGSGHSVDVELGYFNDDEYIDAFVTNYLYPQTNKVWLNDGNGYFIDSGQSPGTSLGVDLGDINGDGIIDAVLANAGPNEVWLGNGDGTFSKGQSFGSSHSHDVELIDLNGNSIYDAVFIVNLSNQPNELWFNDGYGNFIDSGLSFGNSASYGAAIDDFNGDGLLDIFVANAVYYTLDRQPNKIWLNTSFIIVEIDIKPGSDPNSINLGSNGNVPVAIFSTEDFDATTVDPLTVTLAGASVKIKGKGTPMYSVEDIDGDGIDDMIIHIDTIALELSVDDTEAVLEGQTFDGHRIRGVDTVRIVQE